MFSAAQVMIDAVQTTKLSSLLLGNRPIKKYQRTHSSLKNASDTNAMSAMLSVDPNRGYSYR